MNETNHSTNPCLETVFEYASWFLAGPKCFLPNLGWLLTGLPVPKTSLISFNWYDQLVVASPRCPLSSNQLMTTLDHFISANDYLGPGKYYFGHLGPDMNQLPHSKTQQPS